MILKQSTATDVLIGPFVDITDGATSETGESPSVKLSKNGQTLAAKSDATTPVHDADGYYNCELDATDTNTVGTLVLTVAASANALPVRHEFQVVEEDTYEFLYASGSTPDTDIAAILTDTGTTLQAELDGIQADTEDIQTRLPAALVSGRMDSDVGAMQSAVITAAAIAADAIGASELAADAANEIADAILNRDVDNVESGAPVHSLAVAILKAVSRIRDNAGTLEVYQTDGTTLKMSQTVTTDATHDPVDELSAGS